MSRISKGTRLGYVRFFFCSEQPIRTRSANACHHPAINTGRVSRGNSLSTYIAPLEPLLYFKQLEPTFIQTKMVNEGKALSEALLSAKAEGRLTVGVYECAKIMNEDPDSVSFCLLATDDFECDIALQIHFTLIQAFCFDNDISIVRVNDLKRLNALVGGKGQLEEAHCVLITNPTEDSWEDPALEKLHLFCEESRSYNEWVPEITLPER
ncbi:growth arrest and DNA damage-inducible protein GADD45 gamma-like [Danio rerio]|uniref:Growth arrest and DNA damage-inducible protein GADD45 gamma-like n=1 Tax=Danio rerio TaxID=7955 RepID=A0A8M1Q1K2_DANRE|nr:growth arrest and DNA damage-inducible protein GADD45 gamma-like [Danio rerio]|eukprot:XP_001337468.2 growth arrest and DNA damage-inducible protein GADD45 gamma-like [Danio rerio]